MSAADERGKRGSERSIWLTRDSELHCTAVSAAKSKRRKDDGRFELRHGPYHPPRVRRGGRLFCENLGTVKVCTFSDGPIPWPKCPVGERGGPAFVLCGDLVRAVRLESATAVARAWGVSPSTISRWRRILGVAQFNPGTHYLFLTYQGKALTAETTARGRAMQTPERQAEWGRKRREEGRTRRRRWTDSQDAMLGTMPDRDVARRVGCPTSAVGRRRRELGIAPFVTTAAGAAALKAFDASLLRCSPDKLRACRLACGLFQTEVARRCGWKQPVAYGRLESGMQRRATPRILGRIAEVLGCRVADITERA